MFKNKETGFREGLDTLVGPNTVFVGNLESEGTIRIDGKVNGDIKASGDIIIGDNAVITGNLSGNNIHLSGTVEGNITSKGILKIMSSAKLYGDIKVHSFVADEGALFQGKCNMTENTEQAKGPEKQNMKKNYKKGSVLEDVYEDKSSGVKGS